MGTAADDDIVEWLLGGDPSVVWQVKRDLLAAPAAEVTAARAQVAKRGWGRKLVELQSADGRWTAERGPRGFRGLYIPKFTST